MSSEQPTSPQTLSAASIATQLGCEGIPEGYIAFLGYLRAGSNGTHRIFVDSQFLRWLEVDEADIVGRLAGSSGDGREQIFVKRRARVARCEVANASDVANEGWGVDTDPLEEPDAAETLIGGGPRRPRRRPNPQRRIPPPY